MYHDLTNTFKQQWTHSTDPSFLVSFSYDKLTPVLSIEPSLYKQYMSKSDLDTFLQANRFFVNDVTALGNKHEPCIGLGFSSLRPLIIPSTLPVSIQRGLVREQDEIKGMYLSQCPSILSLTRACVECNRMGEVMQCVQTSVRTKVDWYCGVCYEKWHQETWNEYIKLVEEGAFDEPICP